MTSQYHVLYNVHPHGFEDQNVVAHPGGGTETVEVPSGEGLVEDQYEAHLRAMDIAYREPVAEVLAALGDHLEESGFSKMASHVDELLEQFVVMADKVDPATEVRQLVVWLLDKIDKPSAEYDNEVVARYTLNDVVAFAYEKKWKQVLNSINRLTSGEIWEGSVFTIGLKNLFGDLYRSTAIDKFDRIKEIATEQLQFAKQDRAKESPQQVEQKQRLQLLNMEVSKVDKLWQELDYKIDKRERLFIESDIAKGYSQAIDQVVAKHIRDLNWWQKNREWLLSPQNLTILRYNDALNKINHMIDLLKKINQEADQVYNQYQNKSELWHQGPVEGEEWLD